MKTREDLKQDIMNIVYSETNTICNMQNMTLTSWGCTIQTALAIAISKAIDHALHNPTHEQFEKAIGLKE
jgi:hypothetical protein